MSTTRPAITALVCDGLEKISVDREPRPLDTPLTLFPGGRLDIQLAIEVPLSAVGTSITIELTGPLASAGTLEAVRDVPCTWPTDHHPDEGYLFPYSGSFPDLLEPLPDSRLELTRPGWQGIWISLTGNTTLPAGTHPLGIRVKDARDDEVWSTHLTVGIAEHALPPLPIHHTEWFHVDGLAQYYDVDMYSEEHWDIIDRFIAAAAQVHVNTLLTPVWTPPLDTGVDSYRMNVQLLDIEIQGGEYRFGFERLERWIEICRAAGITTLEMPHLFTQWGAKATPAIYASEGGEEKRIFGWDVPATDPRYGHFLQALLPQLTAFLEKNWGTDAVIWHISDEPHGEEQRASYRAARDVAAPLLEGQVIVDALSDLGFYTEGLVPLPVAASTAIGPFLEHGVSPLWVYYCVAQQRGVANRFIQLPSARSRVIAPQIYASGVSGFLHWGFNFYNAQFSTHPIDPFGDSVAQGSFIAGDAYLVYPGEGGEAWHSIRSRVITAAMNDLRLMALVESLHGRDAVLGVIDPDRSLTFHTVDPDPADYLRRIDALTRLAQSAPAKETNA